MHMILIRMLEDMEKNPSRYYFERTVSIDDIDYRVERDYINSGEGTVRLYGKFGGYFKRFSENDDKSIREI